MGRLDASQFTKSRKIFVKQEKIEAPAGSGFRKIVGTVWYLREQRALSIFITGERLPNNKGPNLSMMLFVDWPEGGSSVDKMRLHLLAVLRQTYEELASRETPERRIQMDRCNTTGMTPEEFVLTQCADCRCWYCELSNE